MGSIALLLLLGVAFHLLCICSILDIYFQSPVDFSVPSAAYTSSPPAKRVIIFTLDGCRVDKLLKVVAGYEDRYDLNGDSSSTPTKFASNSRTPFLGDVVRNRGSWGVSHNHAPTESRPCHVALTAGMYEDPHAVTKSWKQHPVPFDSVFNQSSSAFIYGNKDVAPMLARHAPQATEEHYTAKEEADMVRKDPTLLDVWAYEKMRDLFARGTEAKDAALHKKLNADKLVIYCHYLGTDLTGPRFGADSREYLENIAVVDGLIQKTEKMIDEYYGNDGRTAYVLNSDHGMDLVGGHGENDPSKTRTAIIAWGAGVHRPVVVNRTTGFEFDLSTQSRAELQMRLQAQELEEQVATQEWATLVKFKRKDVMQTDVAPLISALAGLPYPRNSVGVLPFAYLTKNKYRVNATRANAQQLYQHALRKEQVKRANRGLLFFLYSPLHSRVPDLLAHIDEALTSIPANEGGSNPIHNEAHHAIEMLSQEMIDICRNAIEYYNRYDWLFLLGSVTLGYVGWALTMTVAYLQREEFRMRWLLVDTIDVKFVAAVTVVLWWRFLANSPSTHYVYGLCPLFLWKFVWNRRSQLQAGLPLGSSFAWQKIIDSVVIFVCLELVVFGIQRRALFSFLFVMLALRPRIAVGQAQESSRAVHQRDSVRGKPAMSPRFCWSTSCLLIAVFPCFSSDYDDSTLLVHIGALVTLVLAFAILRRSPTTQPESKAVLKAGVPPVLMALFILQWTTNIISSRSTLPFFLVAVNWALVITPPIFLLVQTNWQSKAMWLPLLKEEKVESSENSQPDGEVSTVRLVKVALAFTPALALLSTSFEMLFYAALCGALTSWLMLEATRNVTSGASDRREVQRALILMLFSQIAFFGTNSVASMTSFQSSSTRRFLTGSAPSVSQALIVLKILIPFVTVGCAFRLVLLLPSGTTRGKEQRAMPARVSPYFLLAVSLADVLAVQYLFLVNNEGSWKQMGNSIAEFCIVNAQIVLLPTMVFVAWIFVHDLEPVDKEDLDGDDKAR